MLIEPFNLKGKTIEEAYHMDDNEQLVIQFTDGTKCVIESSIVEDEITGAYIPSGKITLEQL